MTMSLFKLLPFLLLDYSALASPHKTRKLRGGEAGAECLDSVVNRVSQQLQEGNNRRDLLFFDEAWGFVTGLYDSLAGAGNETEVSEESTFEDASFADVIIIGAGMAGISAAMEIQATDPDLSILILESTDRTGGRVRSHTMGATGREVVVEDGANWIIPFNANPLWQRAQEMSLEGMINDYNDWTVYDESGNLVDPNLVEAELKRFKDAFDQAGKDADEQFSANHADFNDRGVLALLADNGWTVASDSTGNLDYIMQWLYIDFEYAVADVSSRYFPYTADNPYLVTDQRGYSTVIDNMKEEHSLSDRILLNKRVTTVDYTQDVCMDKCVGICLGPRYKALVKTDDGAEYYGQRVVSTVSTGVLNNDLITFNPPLAYPHEVYSPYYMAQYVKIFYQFDIPFWDGTEFTEVTRGPANRGHCHHWQNMELAIPGSGIIRCELMTEAFLELVDADTQELSASTLDSLLDPLRAAYGPEVVGDPIDVYYPKLNKDVDFGYGAYSAWKIGKTFTDFAKFFGGISELTGYCEHNGCNADDEWVLHLSGSASCYDYSEFVHGGYFSGQRSARHVLASLGYDVKSGNSGCDAYWNELEGFAQPQPSAAPSNPPTETPTASQPTSAPTVSAEEEAISSEKNTGLIANAHPELGHPQRGDGVPIPWWWN